MIYSIIIGNLYRTFLIQQSPPLLFTSFLIYIQYSQNRVNWHNKYLFLKDLIGPVQHVRQIKYYKGDVIFLGNQSQSSIRYKYLRVKESGIKSMTMLGDILSLKKPMYSQSGWGGGGCLRFSMLLGVSKGGTQWVQM